ncbi:MAG: hypothetical protein ACI81R_002881 [Bradymonadia bacterium]|jgi:hypothetical protein
MNHTLTNRFSAQATTWRLTSFIALTFLLCACSGDAETADSGSELGVDVAEQGDLVEADDASPDSDATTAVGSGLFAEGCPVDGESAARQIGVDAHLRGTGALGGRDDFLLMNAQSAFVIQAARRTDDPDNEALGWWYYGGQPIDAVAMQGCDQAHDEKFDEIGIILGTADVAQLDQSVLRGFRADTVEVVADGSDGASAVVRATGVDDRFWLIEQELIRRSFVAGRPTGLSDPLGVAVVVDYILPPIGNVLRIEVTLQNSGDRSVNVITGLVNFFGDGTTVTRYSDSTISLAGLNAAIGIPWLSGHSDSGSWAVALAEGAPATVSISGVDALVDSVQLLTGARVPSEGARTDTMYFAVGATDANSATEFLADVDDETASGLRYSRVPWRVRTEDGSGLGLAGAQVVLERRNSTGAWSTLDVLYTDDEGAFVGTLPRINTEAETRLRGFLAGRATPDAVPIDWDAAATSTLVFGPVGEVRVAVTDSDGAVMPAKVIAWRDGREVSRGYSWPGDAVLPLPPGDVEISVTRGFEYAPVALVATIPDAGGTVELTAQLDRVVDTTGYLSMDGHIHAGPSPDSLVSIPDRLVTVAGEGVEVAVSTDHEAIVPWAPSIVELGISEWIATVLGAEVTAALPEHSNAYPFPPAMDDHPRGRPVRWYGLDVEGLFAASRERGAEVVALNHPRAGCNYMCLIDYDRLTGEARLDDPTTLGFEEDAVLWSWDFDTVEYMNGHRSPFVDPDNPNETGHFEDWMSFHNLGKRVTATGVTDVHGFDAQGSPRNYFRVDSDEVSEFTDDDLVTAMLGGRSLVSAGAFARVSIGSASLGDTVSLADSSTLSIEVQALPEIDVTEVLVFANCDEIARLPATDPDGLVKLSAQVALSLEVDAHIVVLGFGQGAMPRGLRDYDPAGVPRFTTNPIFVDVDGDGEFTPPGGKTCEYTLPSDNKDDELDDRHTHAEEHSLLDRVPTNGLLIDQRSGCFCGGEH